MSKHSQRATPFLHQEKQLVRACLPPQVLPETPSETGASLFCQPIESAHVYKTSPGLSDNGAAFSKNAAAYKGRSLRSLSAGCFLPRRAAAAPADLLCLLSAMPGCSVVLRIARIQPAPLYDCVRRVAMAEHDMILPAGLLPYRCGGPHVPRVLQ